MTEKTVDHSIRAHARLSASRISRVSLCPGSLLAEETMPPEPPSEAALRGTIVHELAEDLLHQRSLPEDADPELVKMAYNYVKAVNDFTSQAKRLYVELDVTPALQAIHPALGGTADLVAVGGGLLTVADLKTGYKDVDPEWNPQLLTYALGAALALKAPDNIGIRLAIYQQTSGGWKEWHCQYADLLDWKNRLQEIATQALTQDAPRNPSASACQYCRARAVCPALRGMAVTIAQDEFGTEMPKITTTMLDEAQLCMTWAEAVMAAAKDQLTKDAESIIGWKLRDGRKMVKWKDEKMACVLLADKPDAWSLKSASSIQKLGLDLPAGLFEETRAAPSLVKVK